jgi:hypothetical protein
VCLFWHHWHRLAAIPPFHHLSLCSLSFLCRQLARLCHQHPFNSARWLAVEMVKWEHVVNSSRPSGARYVNPTPLGATTIRKYLKAMGISSCRCQPVSFGLHLGHRQCERALHMCLMCLPVSQGCKNPIAVRPEPHASVRLGEEDGQLEMEPGVFPSSGGTSNSSNNLLYCTHRHASQVIFSDEKRFLVFGDKPLRCWRRQGQRLQGNFIRSRTQSKVGIMCWLALKQDGTSVLLRCPPTVGSSSYKTAILTPSLPFLRGCWFQQDNAPAHVSASTRAWLAHNRVKVLPGWPACSPDLNIVENAWAWLARQLVGKTFSNADALWAGVQAAWATVPPLFVRSLYSSIP